MVTKKPKWWFDVVKGASGLRRKFPVMQIYNNKEAVFMSVFCHYRSAIRVYVILKKKDADIVAGIYAVYIGC